MAINKRTKSFSPYSYSPNYKKIGVMPNQQNRNYSNFTNVPEEYYVVSKKAPKYNVFARSVFSYSYTNDCDINFLRGETKFQILNIGDNFNREFNNFEYISDINDDTFILDDFSVNDKFTWISDSIVETKNKYDFYFDYIILENNKKYVNAKVKLTERSTIRFEFYKPINRIKSSIKIILFILNKEKTGLDSTRYDIIDLSNNDIKYDHIRNAYFLKNKFGLIDIIPIFYNNDNERYLIYPDLTPSNILIDEKQFSSLKTLNNEKEKNFLEIEKIIKSNNDNNDIIKNNIIKNKIIDEKIHKIESNNSSIDIGKCFLYRSKINKSFIVKYGINNLNIEWNKNSVLIKHDLDGYVKIFIDDSTIVSGNFLLEYVSNNEIKIIFNESIPKEFYLNIFKV